MSRKPTPAKRPTQKPKRRAQTRKVAINLHGRTLGRHHRQPPHPGAL